MKRLRTFLYSKSFNIIFSILLNIGLFVYLSFFLYPYSYMIFCFGITLLFFICLIFRNSNSKTNFILLLICTCIPLLAICLFRYSSNVRGNKRLRNKWTELNSLETGYTQEQNNAVLSTLSSKGAMINKTSKYLNASLNAPCYENNTAVFIGSGDQYFDDVAKSIRAAKKYIFIECNKMSDCKVWRDIFQLLKERTFAGVEVKLLYDDYNSRKAFKDKKTFQKLFNHKIETLAFNPLGAGVGKISAYRNYNNTIIIDGEFAYTGQFGISDDFVDKSAIGDAPKKKIACSVYVAGDAVISLTKNFVINWNLFASQDALVLEKYLPKYYTKIKNKTYIQPFEINPLVAENVCKNIQNNIINCATNSLWIISPYLLIGSESRNALISSFRCGVDVNIIVSKNYQSKWKNDLAYTNYYSLVKEGIKVYTVDKTQLESQMIIADCSNLLLGAGNVDSRKMYSPFQNGILIFSEEVANNAMAYVEEILPFCEQLTLKHLKKRKIVRKFNGAILKIFSPIM